MLIVKTLKYLSLHCICHTKVKFPIICVCSIGSLYLIYHTLISRVVCIRFLSLGLCNSLCVLGCCCWSVAQCRKSEKFLVLYILYVLRCNVSFFFGCVIPLWSGVFYAVLNFPCSTEFIIEVQFQDKQLTKLFTCVCVCVWGGGAKLGTCHHQCVNMFIWQPMHGHRH